MESLEHLPEYRVHSCSMSTSLASSTRNRQSILSPRCLPNYQDCRRNMWRCNPHQAFRTHSRPQSQHDSSGARTCWRRSKLYLLDFPAIPCGTNHDVAQCYSVYRSAQRPHGIPVPTQALDTKYMRERYVDHHQERNEYI